MKNQTIFCRAKIQKRKPKRSTSTKPRGYTDTRARRGGGCANDERTKSADVDDVGETRALTERNDWEHLTIRFFERRLCFFFSHFSVISIIGRERDRCSKDENPTPFKDVVKNVVKDRGFKGFTRDSTVVFERHAAIGVFIDVGVYQRKREDMPEV